MDPQDAPYFAHESAYIDTPCEIGEGTKIWHFSHVMKNVRIGKNCVLGQNTHIANDVTIGNNVKIQNNVSVYTGCVIEDDVFLGPSCVFTNVTNPRSEIVRHHLYERTFIKRGASIGANATILCGHTLGRYAFIAAGAVVASDVPDYALMMGVPARQVGWISRHGRRLPTPDSEGVMVCPESGWRYRETQPAVLRCLDCDEDAPMPTDPSDAKMESRIVSVPLLDLKAQYQTIRSEVNEAIQKVLDTQRFVLGPEVQALEKEIAAYSRRRYAVGVSSGTDALLVSLMALDIGPGDEVITTPYTFFATSGVIHRLGAKPIFVDIQPDTYNIDPDGIRKAITEKTKAILPVHLYGQCADMDPILKIAREKGIPVIEDAAQAIGSEYKGRRAGSLGDLGCFSFFPSKNLGGFGDGGMVVTNDEMLHEKIKSLRAHGAKPKYHHKMVGGNFRLDALQAAVLRVKLKYLDEWTKKRQRNAQRYKDLFKKTGLVGKALTLPAVVQNRHIFNQYVIRPRNRDDLKAYLKERNIGTEIYYPVPMHLQECFKYLGRRKGDFPVSEEAALSTLAIPIYPELTDEQCKYVVKQIAAFYSSS